MNLRLRKNTLGAKGRRFTSKKKFDRLGAGINLGFSILCMIDACLAGVTMLCCNKSVRMFGT